VSDIVERLLAVAAMDLRTGPILAHTLDTAQEAAATIERLTAELERLRDMIDNRNEFIASKGLWPELGQYLSEPHAVQQSAIQERT
jgi:hypothetical protein